MKNGGGVGGGGGMCACSFSRTAAGNRAVPVSPYVATALSAFGSSSTSAFFEARCKKKPAVKVASYFNTHRSLILNWIICHSNALFLAKGGPKARA